MNAIPMEVTDDRKVTAVIDGEEYELVFNTRAAKIVADKYGGLEEFGDEMMKVEKAGSSLDQSIWLFMVLVNQGIAIHNRRDPEHQKPFFTEDDIELLTVPSDLNLCIEAVTKGSRRDVRSEDASKNVPAAE